MKCCFCCFVIVVAVVVVVLVVAVIIGSHGNLTLRLDQNRVSDRLYIVVVVLVVLVLQGDRQGAVYELYHVGWN